MPRGHRRDQRLRSVAACHADNVCPTRNRVLGQLGQVVPRRQDDRLDSPGPALLGQVEALRLAATGPGIHDQDGVTRPFGWDGPPGVRPAGSRGAAERDPSTSDRCGGEGCEKDNPGELRARDHQAPGQQARRTGGEDQRAGADGPVRDTAYQPAVTATRTPAVARTIPARFLIAPLSSSASAAARVRTDSTAAARSMAAGYAATFP
jgi:hypothetical protein